MSPETMEGRLLAQRKILARLVAAIATTPEGAALTDWMRDQSVVQDGQEDPGALPGEAVAVEAALADETRRILDLAERLRSASQRP